MASAQDGRQAEYARLLREIVPMIRAVAAHHHRTPDRVDDVVQDVLLTLHRVRHTYDPARPFIPWLVAVARRRSIDALRRRIRMDAMEIRDDTSYETFADPLANREREGREAADALAVALAALPRGQREALELVKVKEMSLVEASAVSGQSVGGLKVNVHRAIKALRAKLKGG
ncbi:MAG: sigma-70 family RNA polymerase sigma factor [Alphaproteobacteria bacterium]|nr:sigma-70 family RNA polymerase sigma factor [Alphaproteobacteria bacterium]